MNQYEFDALLLEANVREYKKKDGTTGRARQVQLFYQNGPTGVIIEFGYNTLHEDVDIESLRSLVGKPVTCEFSLASDKYSHNKPSAILLSVRPRD